MNKIEENILQESVCAESKKPKDCEHKMTQPKVETLKNIRGIAKGKFTTEEMMTLTRK